MAKKGATNSGGGAARSKERDSAMAAQLKKMGAKRTQTNCPVCGKYISLSKLENHIAVHS